MRTHRLSLFSVSLAVLLAGAACGGDDDDAGDTPDASPDDGSDDDGIDASPGDGPDASDEDVVSFADAEGGKVINEYINYGESLAVASNFPMNYRYTGSALTSDLAWLFGAGFAPWVALELSSRFGLGFAGAYLLSGAIGTLVALFVNRQMLAQDK